MSSYDSSSQGSDNNQNQQHYFKVFLHDHYLSGSLHLVEDWKGHIKTAIIDKQTGKVDPFQYMAQQACIFDREQNMLLAAYHIRFYVFGFYMDQAFKHLIKQYKQLYKKQQINIKQINLLDQKVTHLSFYIQKIELSRASSYIQQIDGQLIPSIYQSLQLIFPMILSPYTIWRLVMFLQIMHQEQNFYVMNIPFNMEIEYYLKTYKTLKFKNQTLTEVSLKISNEHDKGNYLQAYIIAMREICIKQAANKKKNQDKQKQQDDNEKYLNEQLKCEFLCCLKYMYYVTEEQYKSPQKDLMSEYIFSSLKVPHYGKNQNMPTQYYEKLFLKVLTQFKNYPRLIDVGLYIDPNVVGERSKQSFGRIQQVVLKLCQQVAAAQSHFLKTKQQPKEQHIKKLLQPEPLTLLIQFLQTIMQFNKSAFLNADNQTYETFLDMAEFLKNVFLSFGEKMWLFPQNVFTPLTLGFFKKISEDINDDLKNILYVMVENLNQDNLPQKLIYKDGQLKIEQVTRLQYLCAIMYYIEDCSRQEEYLNLPEIAPANLQTSILLIKSLHVKLKHHEPNPAQLPLFTEYLKECQKYKLHINFSWFQNSNYQSKSFQRQTQFQIESDLPSKQIRQLYRKCLNFRDRQYARKLIEEDYNKNHLLTAIQLAGMLKYNHGIQELPQIQNIKEQQVFMILQEMQTMLAILPDELFDIPLEEEINVSYLHLLLTFYCSKIKQAKGSQIYLMILQKVLLNYLKFPFAKSKNFKQKYPKFFQQFIYQYHQIEILATLNEMIMQFQEKYLPFQKNQDEWTEQQKTAVEDLRQKIQIVRDQFLDKLEGSQQQISMFMVTFTSLISAEVLPFSIFLESIRLFVKLINKKPSLGEIASLQIFLSTPTYKMPNFFANMMEYFQNYISQDNTQKREVKVTLIKHLLKSPQILETIQFKQLIDLVNIAKKIFTVNENTDDLKDFYLVMKSIVQANLNKIRPQWFLPYILLFYRVQIYDNTGQMYGLFNEQPQILQKNQLQQLQNLMKLLKSLQENKDFWSILRQNVKNFKFKEYDFLFVFIDQIKDTSNMKNQIISFKKVWIQFLKYLNDPSWTFYHMLRLNDPTLINIHENRDDVLVNLIKNQKLTKQSYPIFKNMISETKNMQKIIKLIMNNYEKQQNYVENYQFHNKLILINERFPSVQVQNAVLKWIKIGQNKLPLKIPQQYYITEIKEQLKQVSDNVAYDLILKMHTFPDKLRKLSKDTQKLFQILLYFPVKKFQNINLSQILTNGQQDKGQIKNSIQQQTKNQGQDEEWQQEDDQNQDVQIKKTEGGKQQQKKENKKVQDLQQQDLQKQDSSQSQQQQNGNYNYNGSEDENNNYYDNERPSILQIFYEQQKKNGLEGYKNFCRLREEIDIYLKSDYDKLKNSPIADNQYLNEKLLQLLKQLCAFEDTIQQSILVYLPQQLHAALKQLGYTKDRQPARIQKLRKPRTKIFKLQNQMFSQRNQSDRQSQQEDDQDNYTSQNDGEQDDWDNQDDDQNDLDQDQIMEEVEQEINNGGVKPKKNHANRKQSEEDFQLPQLNSQFSKIQSEVKGNQLNRVELTKILQIFLIQLFRLTPINFKKKQIVFSYVEIMQSPFGQIFFESILTVLRTDENHANNRKTFLQTRKAQLQKSQNKFKIEQILGLCQFSKYNGLMNFCHLMKTLQGKQIFQKPEQNPFRRQSGSLLPIAEKCIIQFDLPLQTNMFSLILLYIHSKPRIRQLLEPITPHYDEEGVKMTKKQIKRIGQAFLNQKTHSSVWQYIESKANYIVKDTDRLIISLDSYSKEVFKALSSSASRVKETIQKNSLLKNKMTEGQNDNLQNKFPHNSSQTKHYQRLYYIASNLLSSCSQEIKQFYFMNKNICRYLWDDDEQNNDTYNYKKVPVKLLKCKRDILTNQSFVLLVELAFRVIYFVKQQLYGKISSRKFTRLIHYPKLIIQTATLYMHLSGKKGTKDNWNFKPVDMVQKFVSNYQMGQYQFKDLVEVYNLILGLLEIQSFCTGKFKQLLIPYFTQHTQIGLQAPLMFKVPQIDEDVNGQNIFVTRQCSFDMAFYQVNGEGLFVEFHGQEGSDHGGMIRQLMMGWKGVGVGEEDFFIGKILGISFRQSVPYGGFVDLQMCIRITNYQITFQNIEQIDKDIYNSLKYVKENDPADLSLTFSVTKKNPRNIQIQNYQLKPNGSAIQVTEANKQEYLELYLKNYYSLGRQVELSQIAAGFYTVVSQAYVSIFKPHELMQHLKGQEVCDINVIKSHVKYTQGYTETSVIIKWVWQILQSYNQEQLNKFVQFLTGSPKLPIFNPNFQITIERVFDVKNLPVAHTCFNTLDLPQYPTKDILQKNLLTAIYEGNDNFGIM